MQVVIDIPSWLYNAIMECKEPQYSKSLGDAVREGTLLSKGHGRLVDADKLTKEIKGYISDTSNLHYDDLEEAEAYNSAYYNCLDEIGDSPTIIEAESEE